MLERQVEKLTKLTDQFKFVPPETIEQATEELREIIDYLKKIHEEVGQ